MTFSTLVGVFLFLTVSAAPTDEATELARALQSPPTDDVATGRVWEILNSSSDQAVLKRAEFGFAERLEARKLPALAFIYCSGILSQGHAHPHFADTLRLLLRVQATIHDDLFISALLEKHFQPPGRSCCPRRSSGTFNTCAPASRTATGVLKMQSRWPRT